jgi:transcriptional regulator with GAF, ATPase, and Fis domain
MRLGAAVTGNLLTDELPLVFARALKAATAVASMKTTQARRGDSAVFLGPGLDAVRAQLERILQADARLRGNLPPVLIEGETGTGKTTFARWLHANGPRAGRPLVEVNCSALPELLAESELFGHERGAFTDARSARIGLFEAADGGTLFLDELPSLSPAIQAKVLKVVEDGRIRRIGGNREIQVDVRLIAATNRNLRELAAAGQFREDLHQRLDLLRVQLPPLRARGDVVNLARHLLEGLARKYGMQGVRLGAAGEARLRAHAWPGNVRELAHELERALVQDLGAAELDLPALGGGNATTSGPDPHDWLNPAFAFPEDGFDLEAAIDRLISKAIEQSNGNISAAARILGVNRDYIRYRLKKGPSSTGP